MKVVVLGGYGNFGARICRALATDPSFEVVATGRNPANAATDFSSLGIRTAALDLWHGDLAHELSKLAPQVVIHCVGPFQGQDYRVPLAVLSASAHYIDLADGRSFVSGFAAATHEAATAAGRAAVSGASTLPALSSAVVDSCVAKFGSLDAIDTVIAPAQRAPRGAATLAGVMSYAGDPFQVWEDGRWQTTYGWQDIRTVSLGPLGKRRSAVCDVPDLPLFPQRYGGLKRASFRAALEVGMQHYSIALLATIRRLGINVPIARWAPALESIANWFDPLGSETGGMTVTMTGRDHSGQPLSMRWIIVAPHNHGPEIPCTAAIILARKIACGKLDRVGGMPCMGLISLDEFAPEFAKWGMQTTWDTS